MPVSCSELAWTAKLAAVMLADRLQSWKCWCCSSCQLVLQCDVRSRLFFKQCPSGTSSGTRCCSCRTMGRPSTNWEAFLLHSACHLSLAGQGPARVRQSVLTQSPVRMCCHLGLRLLLQFSAQPPSRKLCAGIARIRLRCCLESLVVVASVKIGGRGSTRKSWRFGVPQGPIQALE